MSVAVVFATRAQHAADWPLDVAAIGAVAASAAVRYAGSAALTRIVVAAALLAGPVLVVHGGGAALPVDVPLYALAALGALVAYADWRPLTVGAAIAAGTAADLPAAIADGAIVALEALVLTVIVRRFTRRTAIEESRLRRLNADIAARDAKLLDLSEERAAADTARSAAALQIEHLAHHDLTTNLPNRTLLMERLRAALADAAERGTDTIIMYLDLADLKAVNETTGHESGDRALAIIAARIRRCMRAGDTASRVGGDEFVIVCATADGAAETAPIADRLIAAVSEPIRAGDMLMHLGSNIGVSIAPGDGIDPDELIQQAEAAMYRAKESGINTYHLFTAGIHADMLEKAKLRRELESALARDEFVVHYQPIVSLTSRAVIGAEALVRWMHPTRGLLAPAEFIGFAEAHGLIAAIGEVVMIKACAQINRFALSASDEFTLAVNVSAVQFRGSGFVDRVCDVLAAHAIDNARLEIEITESAIMDDAATVIRSLHELEQRGVRLSIDDFGTGYSSLAYVKQFPVHTLKIDRSFVRDLADSVTDQAIATTIITLAHNLGMRVVAEGIETEEQLERLRLLGADDAQGFLISPPLPADEFERFMRAAGTITFAA